MNKYSYLAGIFDGEGCIYIKKGKITKGSVNTPFSIAMIVAMTHYPTIEYLYKEFGGFLFSSKRDDKKHKNIFKWQASKKDMIFLIDKMLPFSITKKKELLVGKEFLSLPLGWSYKKSPKWLLKKKHRLYLKMKKLKTYSFKVKKKNKKKLKKNIYTKCKFCHKRSRAFAENGVKQIYCSTRCSHLDKRILSDKQELQLYKVIKNRTMSYDEAAKSFGIKRGSVGWIVSKYKTQ